MRWALFSRTTYEMERRFILLMASKPEGTHGEMADLWTKTATRLTINQSNLKNDTAIRKEIIMYRYTITIMICMTAVQQAVAKNPTALELLDKYAETQDEFQSFRVKVTNLRRGFSTGLMAGKPWKGRYSTECDARFDKNRASVRARSWGRINLQSFFTKDKPYYVSELWDGETNFRYTEAREEPVHLSIRKAEDANMREGIIKGKYNGKFFMGYFYPFAGRVDSVLRKAGDLSVRPTMEQVGGSPCYVIDAVDEKDRYAVWIDPQHAYHIAKVVIERARSNVQGLQHFVVEYDNVRFQKIGKEWVPVEANLEDRFDYQNGHYCTDSYHIKVTEMVFNPDHDALGSFIPDDIKDGTRIPFYIGSPHRPYYPQYVWSREAKFAADRKGRLVRYEPDKGILPVIKTLPTFKMFELKFEPDETKNKMILLCFVDIKQASEQYASNLAGRASNLAEEGVLVIFVDATGNEKKQVDAWAKQHSITVGVGRLHKELLKEIRQAWGIESLPRLVLTDRNHIVTAEGFGFGELNEIIKEANNAEQ